MTPYRERREKGHYNSPTNTPASVHSTHLPGLLTGARPTPDLDSLTKAELLDLAKAQGISPANAAMSKAELREALER